MLCGDGQVVPRGGASGDGGSWREAAKQWPGKARRLGQVQGEGGWLFRGVRMSMGGYAIIKEYLMLIDAVVCVCALSRVGQAS